MGKNDRAVCIKEIPDSWQAQSHRLGLDRTFPGTSDELEIWLFEERGGWPIWVRTVGYDDVVYVLCRFLKEIRDRRH